MIVVNVLRNGYERSANNDSRTAIRKVRELKGYSRDELADKLDTHKNNIDSWENGKHYPSLIMAMCMADVFGCTLDELTGRTEIDS